MLYELAPKLNRYPGQFSVLLLDNISFHHNFFFQRMMHELGVIIAYLPHYDPKSNLAEIDFRNIKTIEKSKKIYGKHEGLMSLARSVEAIKHTNHIQDLKSMGYIL